MISFRDMHFEWVRRQWDDIKGNVKFWLLSTILAGVAAGGTWAVTRVERLIHDLPPPERTMLLAVYIATFAALLAAVAWAVASSWMKHRIGAGAPVAPVSLPAPPSIVPSRLPKDIDLHVEVKELLFRRKGGFMVMGSFYVLVNMRVTNRGHGHTEPSAIDWKLDLSIGDAYHGHGKVVPVPASWRLERQVDGSTTTEDIGRPSLDEMMQSTPFRKGTPISGWVLFEVFEFQSAALPPYNATVEVTIVDSMGNEHNGVRGSGLYIEFAKIVSV